MPTRRNRPRAGITTWTAKSAFGSGLAANALSPLRRGEAGDGLLDRGGPIARVRIPCLNLCTLLPNRSGGVNLGAELSGRNQRLSGFCVVTISDLNYDCLDRVYLASTQHEVRVKRLFRSSVEHLSLFLIVGKRNAHRLRLQRSSWTTTPQP